jgi:hypothetical protein
VAAAWRGKGRWVGFAGMILLLKERGESAWSRWGRKEHALLVLCTESKEQGAALSFQERKKTKWSYGLAPGREQRAWADFLLFLLFLFLSQILFEPLENKFGFETKIETSERNSFNINIFICKQDKHFEHCKYMLKLINCKVRY